VVDVEGTISQLDYTLAQRTVERAVRRGRPVSLVVRVGKVRRVTANPGLSDIGLFRNASKYLRRAALVTDDVSMHDKMVQYAPQARTYVPEFSAELRAFGSGQYDEAVSWACAGVHERE
jgi:hypothetical protein